ncbi:MAG: hypothetical protein NC122_01070 [Faecalibacterium sp.]|nr:hypothetical protein [Ruminococcus sp.]MCM1391247.1 hypothetical protein [Ruminococcus sp.]MCM1484779.1 hypothetical protein [Faecalibacterium sp.]
MSKITFYNSSSQSIFITALDIGERPLKSQEIDCGEEVIIRSDTEIDSIAIDGSESLDDRFTKLRKFVGFVLVSLIMLLLGEVSDFSKSISLPLKLKIKNVGEAAEIRIKDCKDEHCCRQVDVSGSDVDFDVSMIGGEPLRRQYVESQVSLILEFMIGFLPLIAIAIKLAVIHKIGGLILVLVLLAAVSVLVGKLFIRNRDFYRKVYENVEN